MKKKLFLVFLTLSVLTLIFVSCKSTQPKETPKSEQAAPPPASNAAKTKAEQARKQALDFESNNYFPSEWEAAEAQFKAADDSAKYNAVAEVYTDLFKKTIPLYAQAREDELMTIRGQIIASGFSEVFPQYLKNADDLALSAKDKYDNGDYYGAKDAADAALREYQTLLTGANVYLTRQQVIDRNFTQYDPDNFLKADEISQKAIDAYNSGDKEAAFNNAEEALLRYNLVLSTGWTAYASERKDAAEKERQAAVADRANIASKETFRKGETLFDNANDSYKQESYSDAALAFVEAEAVFAVSRKETEEKRIKAEEAIRIAEEKIEESGGSALEAEKLIEGGSK